MRKFLKQVKAAINRVWLNHEKRMALKNEPDFKLSDWSRSDINNDGYILKRSTKTLLENNVTFAAVTVIYFWEDIPMIVTDFCFDKLSKQAQSYIIAHELGHVKKWFKHRKKRDLKYEVEADINAVETLGLKATISAMNEVIAFLNKYNFVDNEFQKRKEMLLEYYK